MGVAMKIGLAIVVCIIILCPIAYNSIKVYYTNTSIFLAKQINIEDRTSIADTITKLCSHEDSLAWVEWIDYLSNQKIYQRNRVALKKLDKNELIQFIPKNINSFVELSSSLDSRDFYDIEEKLDQNFSTEFKYIDSRNIHDISMTATRLIYVLKTRSANFDSSEIIKALSRFSLLTQKISPDILGKLTSTSLNKNLIQLVNKLYINDLLVKTEKSVMQEVLLRYLEEAEGFQNALSNESRAMSNTYQKIKVDYPMKFSFVNLYGGAVIPSYKSYMDSMQNIKGRPSRSAEGILALPFLSGAGVANLPNTYNKISEDFLRVKLMMCQLDKTYSENSKFVITDLNGKRVCKADSKYDEIYKESPFEIGKHHL